MSWPIYRSAYIDAAFVPVHGGELQVILHPVTGAPMAEVMMAGPEEVDLAVQAAARAQREPALQDRARRIEMLRSLQASVLSHEAAIRESVIEEYGAPLARASWVGRYASDCFGHAADLLRDHPFRRTQGSTEVWMEPVGVSALLVPWNSIAGTMCSKLASALAAGCASVIKPSEFSPWQTQAVAEALHEAGLPPGIFNIVSGSGTQVGQALCTHPAVSKVSFTGSTATGKLIARAGVETMKRVSLALGGKSATIVLDDADLATALPMAIAVAFMNNGQACVAGSRLLVPRSRLDEIEEQVRHIVDGLVVGNPRDPATGLGPLASQAQYERVQQFIRRGQAEGARLLIGGEGHPAGLEHGWFVRPTVFADVANDMDIARQEIFGPVLCLIAYDDDQEAVRIANDSPYGLQAYVFSAQAERARRMAGQLQVGSVLINRIAPDLMAPFGGVKQSGVGREFGAAGIDAFLEPKTVVTI